MCFYYLVLLIPLFIQIVVVEETTSIIITTITTTTTTTTTIAITTAIPTTRIQHSLCQSRIPPLFLVHSPYPALRILKSLIYTTLATKLKEAYSCFVTKLFIMLLADGLFCPEDDITSKTFGIFFLVFTLSLKFLAL